MKKILFDSNYNYLGPQYPTVSPKIIEELNLQADEEILGEMDGEVWKCVLKYDEELPVSMKWYIAIGEQLL